MEKAHISPSYKWRLGIIGLACLAFSAWFFYDGLVKYPRKQFIHDEYLRIQAEHPEDFPTRWVQHAQEHGWATSVPKPYSDLDITTQFIFAGITVSIGLVFAIAFWRASGRWIGSDEQGLHTSWSQHVSWGSIQAVDKARWKTKGIAAVQYGDDAGAAKKLTLDDWKYQREPIVKMVAQVDEQLGLTPAAATEAAMTPAQRKGEELAS